MSTFFRFGRFVDSDSTVRHAVGLKQGKTELREEEKEKREEKGRKQKIHCQAQ